MVIHVNIPCQPSTTWDRQCCIKHYVFPNLYQSPGLHDVHNLCVAAVFKQNEDTYGIFRTHKTRSLKQVMLRTKYKGRDRTYYQAFDSEQEMMRWVDCLCLVLGLKENDGVHLIGKFLL